MQADCTNGPGHTSNPRPPCQSLLSSHLISATSLPAAKHCMYLLTLTGGGQEGDPLPLIRAYMLYLLKPVGEQRGSREREELLACERCMYYRTAWAVQ